MAEIVDGELELGRGMRHHEHHTIPSRKHPASDKNMSIFASSIQSSRQSNQVSIDM